MNHPSSENLDFYPELGGDSDHWWWSLWKLHSRSKRRLWGRRKHARWRFCRHIYQVTSGLLETGRPVCGASVLTFEPGPGDVGVQGYLLPQPAETDCHARMFPYTWKGLGPSNVEVTCLSILYWIPLSLFFQFGICLAGSVHTKQTSIIKEENLPHKIGSNT